MKKNAFTLIEVIAVITILGIIALIAVPAVNNSLKDAKEKAYLEQIKRIEDISKKYGIENIDMLPDNEENTYIHLDDLINENYLDKNGIINPNTNEKMDGCVEISYNASKNKYSYEYLEVCPVQ